MEILSTTVIHDFDEENGTMAETPVIPKKNAVATQIETINPKKTFRFRYAMETFIDAENEDKAREIFDISNLASGVFVEVESVEEW